MNRNEALRELEQKVKKLLSEKFELIVKQKEIDRMTSKLLHETLNLAAEAPECSSALHDLIDEMFEQRLPF